MSSTAPTGVAITARPLAIASMTDIGRFSSNDGRTRMSADASSRAAPSGPTHPGIATRSASRKRPMSRLVASTSPSPARTADHPASDRRRSRALTSCGVPLRSPSLPRNRMRTLPSPVVCESAGRGTALAMIAVRAKASGTRAAIRSRHTVPRTMIRSALRNIQAIAASAGPLADDQNCRKSGPCR